MKFLFDLQHPAHLHVFRPVIERLKGEGHFVQITGRDKDILLQLATLYQIPMTVFGTARKGFFSLFKEWLYRVWRLHKIVIQEKPDVLIAVAGTFISIVGKWHRIPTYIFYDTEHATLSNLLAYPFATCIYVPRCYRKTIRWEHVRYNGYHELAYLHPRYFTPDESVLDELGLKPNQIFTFVRFVNWGAAHDIGLSGLSLANKIRAIEAFRVFGPVFISSEAPLPGELEKYRLSLAINRVHSLVAYASLVFGESATMVSEGAVLGVPGVYIDPIGRGYTDEEEREYHIVFNFTHLQQEEAINKALSILSQYQDSFIIEKQKWQAIGQRIVSEKIDVAQMIYEVATQYNK